MFALASDIFYPLCENAVKGETETVVSQRKLYLKLKTRLRSSLAMWSNLGLIPAASFSSVWICLGQDRT